MTPLQRLNDFVDHRTVVWIGAGLSMDLGYPDWRTAVVELCRACGLDEPEGGSLTAEDLMRLAGECRSANADAFNRYLSDRFGPSRLSSLSRKSYHDLLQLGQPGYVTTNFDNELRDAATRVPSVDYELMAWPTLAVRPFFSESSGPPVCHLHGLAGDRSDGEANVVLTADDFHSAYEDPGVAADVVRTLLRETPILFVGVGRGLAEDTYMKKLLAVNGRVHALAAGMGWDAPPRRLAVIPAAQGLDGDAAAEERERVERTTEELDDLGVDCLEVPVEAHRVEEPGEPPTWEIDYTALDELFSQLALQRGQTRTIPRVANYGLGESVLAPDHKGQG